MGMACKIGMFPVAVYHEQKKGEVGDVVGTPDTRLAYSLALDNGPQSQCAKRIFMECIDFNQCIQPPLFDYSSAWDKMGGDYFFENSIE